VVSFSRCKPFSMPDTCDHSKARFPGKPALALSSHDDQQEENDMAFDIFVRIDGIEGESTDDQHPGWIEVFNYKVALKQKKSTTASNAGGATAGRADFKPFNFKRPVDKASPKLAIACADGTHQRPSRSRKLRALPSTGYYAL
jgi:hypothetical protein